MLECEIYLDSVFLKGPARVTVLMPGPTEAVMPEAFYRPGKKYKVLWLLHGGMNGNREWIYGTDIVEYVKERRFLAVIPDGLNSDFANHPEFGEGYFFCDFFFRELMPFIHNWFPASERKEDNYLTGYSMGSAAVWSYGLLHPEKFEGIIPLSGAPADYSYLEPYRELTGAEFRALARAHPEKFPAGYGKPETPIHLKEINRIACFETVDAFLQSSENVIGRLREIKEEKVLPGVYLEGNAGTGMEDFQTVLKKAAAGRVFLKFTNENTHCFTFWNSTLKKALDYFRI